MKSGVRFAAPAAEIATVVPAVPVNSAPTYPTLQFTPSARVTVVSRSTTGDGAVGGVDPQPVSGSPAIAITSPAQTIFIIDLLRSSPGEWTAPVSRTEEGGIFRRRVPTPSVADGVRSRLARIVLYAPVAQLDRAPAF